MTSALPSTTTILLHPDADEAGAADHYTEEGGNPLAAANRNPHSPAALGSNEDEEELCGICLEKPPADGFVRLWCCHNILCVTDAQHIGRCPFCRSEPLVWEIEK